MNWLDLLFGLIGVLLGVLGTLSIQKNKTGDNIYNEGYSSDDVTKIVKSIHQMSDVQIKQIKDALLSEFKNRPRIFTGSEEPKDGQEGDFWFRIIESDDNQ